MRKYFAALIILFSLTSLSYGQISAKRAAPKQVSPLIVGQTKYTAPTEKMGWIIARDVATDSVIWKKRVYVVFDIIGMETDVQDVFIDSLYIKGKRLMVHTERDQLYSIKLRE